MTLKISPALAAVMDGRHIVAFDLETTGLDKVRDSVVEAAAVVLKPDGSMLVAAAMFSGGASSPEALKAHGITDESRKGCPAFEEFWSGYLGRLIDGHIVAGHNIVHFDLPFLKTKGSRFNELAAADTYRIATTLGLRNNSLGSLCQKFGIEEGKHRAAGDIIASMHLLNTMLDGIYPEGRTPDGIPVFDDLAMNGMFVAPGHIPQS